MVGILISISSDTWTLQYIAQGKEISHEEPCPEVINREREYER